MRSITKQTLRQIRNVIQPYKHTKLSNILLSSTLAHSNFMPRTVMKIQSRSFATIPFKLADIGEGIAEVEIIKWHIKEGDTVEEFDVLCQVQSDKATVDISSRYSGKIIKLNWEEGDMAKVGMPLVEIETNGSEVNKSKKPKGEKEKAVEHDIIEKVAEPKRSTKRAESIEPIFYGTKTLENHLPKVESVPISTNRDDSKVLTTPAVRRLAKDHKISLDDIAQFATGPNGRLLKEDVLSYIKNKDKYPQIKSTSTLSTESTNSNSSAARTESKEDETTKLKGIQRMMYQTMTKSLQVPHFNYMDEYQFDSFMELRKRINSTKRQEDKMSYMPFIIKAVSLSLTKFPAINTHFFDEDPNNLNLVKKADHNIGVAMDTARGLIVPVIKSCQNKSVAEIHQELVRLQLLGKENKLGENELSGCTFTISNIGSIGGTYMSPVVSKPQVAIVALGKICSKVTKDKLLGSFKEESFINFSYAADHRVIDGATVARFSNSVKSYIETPDSMLNDMR